MSNFLRDTFTDTDNVALTAHTAETGGPWSFQNGTDLGKILSNRLAFPANNTFATYISTGVSAGADVDVAVSLYIASTNGAVGIYGRYQIVSGTGVFYGSNIDVNGISLTYRPSSGPDVTLGFFAKTWTVGQTYLIRIRISDARKVVYVDGVEVISSADNTISGAAGNKAGFLLYTPNSTANGFQPDLISSGPVDNPGTTTASATGTTTVTASSTAATGDTGTYSAQYQRAPDVSGAPGSFADVGSLQSGIALGVAPSNLSDTGLSVGTPYWYRVKATYSLDSTILYTRAASVTTNSGSLVAGTTTATATGPSTTTVANTAATSGTAPYAYQFQRAPDVSGSPGTFANVGSLQSGLGSGTPPTNLSDTGLAPGTLYWYRVHVTDSASGSANSTAVSVSTLTRTPANYFLSAIGNDSSNSGTSSASPWATIAKINSFGLVPGDTVSLRGGDTFSGNLTIQPTSQPATSTRITINSYGTGRATISCATGNGIAISDCGYVTVQNINIAGPGLTSSGSYPTRTVSCSNTGTGIYMVTSDPSTYRSGIVIDNVTITGITNGISAANSGTFPTAAYSDLRISNCIVHDCAWSGITVFGNYPFTLATWVNRRIRISDCQVYNIPGVTAQSGGTGFPIFIFHASDSIIERCVVHNAGDAQNLSATNGAAGIMFGHASNCVMRSCESYDIWAPTVVDGNAFDFDAHCVNCLIEYCYGHDTDGASMLLWNDQGGSPSSSGSIVRYNVFVNGGRRNQSNTACGLAVTPFAGNDILIYNNVFYQASNGSGQTALVNVRSGATGTFFNNIFSVSGGINFGAFVGSALYGNVYDVRSGSSFTISTTSGTYLSLASLRTASYETYSGVPVGAQGDPVFSSAGTHSAVMPVSALSSFAAYDIGAGTLARGAGIDPFIFAGKPESNDWHGNSAIAGADATFSGFDSGPTRYGSSVSTGSTGTRSYSF